MPAPPEVVKLVEDFNRNRDQYLSSSYKEAELRIEFIDPLFECIGWDMRNKAKRAEQYKDVVREQSLEVEGATKAPDYTFRIGGVPKFFVEAKKPSVDIWQDPYPSFQLRRYAWSAKLPLSILTNFEYLFVFDCRVKPTHDDKASNARILQYSTTDFIEKWDEIVSIFSQEAILNGAFDKYAEDVKGKRGTSEVDDEFLKDIEEWREILAKNIANRNKLSLDEMNFAVGKLIDRIIFLRICEDRGTEPAGQLRAIIEKDDMYQRLVVLFQQADAKYNSGLFHFERDTKRAGHPDKITPKLDIDDRILKEIIKNLYYPESPYQFNVIPADILGQVYEQFLGKVIRLTEGGHAKVEEKPEVKKAGGVYYTPKYIVDYIVENTVGRLCAGKSPDEMARLRILDPACGSGSFLIVAYARLLKEHLDWYVADNPKKWKDAVLQARENEWHLTLREKKRILLSNIYGVDIDSQAVEVTKLNLLLKALEGDSKESVENVKKWFREPALPDLDNNIKCGNSLVGFNVIDLLKDIPKAEQDAQLEKLKPFNWEDEFSQVFKAGGFDAIVGNPPYIRIQALNEWTPRQADYLKQHYKAASKGNYDIYVVFVERGLGLLNPDGKLGYILPHKFFNAQYGEPLRDVLSKGKHLSEVVHFSDQQIFDGATTYTCLMFLKKGGAEKLHFKRVEDLAAWRLNGKSTDGEIPALDVSASEWNFAVGEGAELFEKLSRMPTKLKDVSSNIFQGLVTSSDPVYLLEPVNIENNHVTVKSNATNQEYSFEAEVVPPLCKGSLDIRRYLASPSKRVIFPYNPAQSDALKKSILISESDFQSKYPRTWSYLKENYEVLRNREKGKMRHDGWYGYVYPKSIPLFAKKKILTPSIALSASYTLDQYGQLYFVGSGGGGGGGYGIILADECKLSYEYVLGLLNSKLLDMYLKRISSSFRGGYYAYNRQYIEQLPIRAINFSDPADKARHDKMVALVNRMLKLHKDRQAEKLPDKIERVERQIQATDKEIDALVYELYGLTEEEVEIVEGSMVK
ncbi:MAG: N-6 DNA methylase [Euryarchaeota archaeon]|nr:N-6 DNA methylase [Euryarchaeota archaeon]